MSINNVNNNVRSMNGLNNINADSIDTRNLDVDTIQINILGTTPTPIINDNSNKIANTAFINTALNNYVSLNTAQNILATKYFNQIPRTLTTCSLSDHITTKQYVDNAVSTAGGSFVSLTTNQTITGNKNFTGTNILGDVFSTDQPVKTSITNNTVIDSSVKGSIGGESVYHQVRFGGRGFYISQGATNSDRQYFSRSGSGAPDPDVVMVLTENGIKIQNGNSGDTSDYTEALYVVGNSRFTQPLICSVSGPLPSNLIRKDYVDQYFTTLNTSQTITGNKTFKSNTIIWPDSGTTVIRGPQCDIFADITFLTGNTTSIAGVYCNINSTNNYIGGTTTYLASTTTIVNNTCTSFYIDSRYNNFVGLETYINTPYFLVNSNCLNYVNQAVNYVMKSPYITVAPDVGTFEIKATQTLLSGTVATATTQPVNDNSNKLATTAYVNNYATLNYMTISGAQFIPSVKTYEKQQVFNGGVASSNYNNVSLTDMNIAANSANGILKIAGGKILTDTYGVKLASNNRNLQLGDGTFIQPINQAGLNDYSTPSFVYASNRTQGYTDIVGVPNSAQATRQINILQGITSWFAGYNQTTTFTITHTIFTTSSTALASMNEAEVVIYFQDFNTGIVRYTSPNLATTTAFALPANSTVIRPVITFTLTTDQLPEGEYLIMGYSRVINAYAVNSGVLTVNFSYAGATSTDTSIQNYNTATPSTFTSRNLYHCFRNTSMCGVYIVNNIATQQNIMTPIHYSITDFTNFMSQPTITGAVSTPAQTGGTAAGNFTSLSVNNADNYYLVYPNYSIILYDSAGWSGTVYINFKNTGLNPVMVAPTTTQRGSSCRIYFDEVELIKY